MQRIAVVFAIACSLAAQAPPAAPTEAIIRANTASSLQKMETSLEKQKLSVRRQVSTAIPVVSTSAWFTVPWDSPPPAQNPPAPAADCPELPSEQLESLIEKTAAQQKLSATLLREVARQESAFQPCAVSVKGALGLMQLMPGTAADFGVADAFNPEENLSAGAKLLATLLEKYNGDSKLALAAYNAGPERVSQYRGVPPFPETENYVKDILARIDALTQLKQ